MMAEPQELEQDDEMSAAVQPVKKPLAPTASPGVPLAQPTSHAAPAPPATAASPAVNAQANSPDPMAFAPPPGAPLGSPTAGQTTPPAVTPFGGGDASTGQGGQFSYLGRSEGFTPGQVDQFLPPTAAGQSLFGSPTAGQTTPGAVIPRPGDATTAPWMNKPLAGAVAHTFSDPPAAQGTPSDPTGRNRQYLGASRDDGSPIWGDDGVSDQSVRYDAQGNPQWNAGLGGYKQSDYEARASIAKMTPQQRAAEIARLEAANPGLSTYLGRSQTMMPEGFDGMNPQTQAAMRQYGYLTSLSDAEQYNTGGIKALTSDNSIYGKPLQESDDPAYWAQHHLGDPGYAATLQAKQDKDRDALNAKQGYSTIQGGQTFNDPAQGQAAFDKIQAQMKAGGGALFGAQQTGGTIRPDALAQLQANGAGGTGGRPSTGEGAGPGGPPTSGRPGTPGGPPLGTSPPGSSPGGSPASNGPGGAGVALANINPDDALLSKVISPNNTVDRVKTFQDSLNSTIQNVLDPAFAKRQRDTNRYQFGAGRGVSGIARDSQGDLSTSYGQQIKDLTAQGLAGATTGSIDDMYKNIGIAQQQQNFQKGLSDTAFDQSVTGAQLDDSLTNSAFNRAATQTQLGEMNNPSQVAQWLSTNYGMQAGDAMKAAAQLFSNMGQKSGSSGGGTDAVSQFLSWLKSMGGGGSDPSGEYVDDIPMDGVLV